MSHVNKTVSLNCTEKDFIKAFINELTNADSRIVCETDIDAEFENEDTSYTPTIILNVNNCYKLKFKRSATLASITTSYNISAIINDKENNNSSFVFSSIRKAVSDIATRNFNFVLISNDNVISILFGSYDQALPQNYCHNTISYHEQGFNIVADTYTNNNVAIKAEFVRTDEGNKNEIYKVANRLLYTRSDENVEIIESKPLVQNNNVVYDMKNIYDCSNVTANNILLVDNNRYFAIDSNTLIKI